MSEQVVGVDLFAGAGGCSTGFAQACEDLGVERGEDVRLIAINHWEPAIETHRANHPWAEHYCAKIEELHPPDVVEPGTVDLLAAGPECTHFSRARGGKPVSEQKRTPAWMVLDWVEKLRPTHLLLENVPEFRSWGPIDEDGQPERDGSIFERWVQALEALGYSVIYDGEDEDYGVVLNAADYGDPQSRERLFVLASREGCPTKPPQTHSDDDDDLPDRRPAAEIIDWSDPGSSLWTRDLENARVQPLKKKTAGRIAEGIRRHCDDRLAPFADVVEQVGPDELGALRQRVVPMRDAALVADAVDVPFLVRCGGSVGLSTGSFVPKYYGTSTATPIDRPLDTITSDGNHHALCSTDAYLLGQHGGAVPRSVADPGPTVATDGAIGLATVDTRHFVVPRDGAQGPHWNRSYPVNEPLHTVTAKNIDGHLASASLVHYSHGGKVHDVDAPMPTIATERGGSFGLASSYLCPLYQERAGQAPRTRSLDRPLMTVPSSKSPAAVASPYLVQYYGNGDATTAVDVPLPTVTQRDRFALCVPSCWPWGLDIRYRMLKPSELKQAQGFPADYEITGDTKRDRTEQIGNAVPVSLARNLARHLLALETPSLSSFGGGVTADPDASVPDYPGVADAD